MPSHDKPPAQTILIVDQDLGFVMWLGNILALQGYLTLPSTTASQALKVIAELGIATLDLLIVNPALPGTSDLVDILRSDHVALKVILMEDSGRKATDIQETQWEWIAKVQEALGKKKTAGGR
jgi:DNA-binding NtrC family response regulator